jgi:hypothetical protein
MQEIAILRIFRHKECKTHSKNAIQNRTRKLYLQWMEVKYFQKYRKQLILVKRLLSENNLADSCGPDVLLPNCVDQMSVGQMVFEQKTRHRSFWYFADQFFVSNEKKNL